MMRMLIIGYSMGIRSERRLCEAVHLNLAYRWFCRLGLAARCPITLASRGTAIVGSGKGNTAVVGRNAAVFDFGSWQLKGRLAWFFWAFIHVCLLINCEKRLLVSIQWISRYITRQRGACIVDEEPVATKVVRPAPRPSNT
jgi:hypothetical protein